MQIMKMIGNFVQEEILGMNWLSRLIGLGLEKIGIDTNESIGGRIYQKCKKH